MKENDMVYQGQLTARNMRIGIIVSRFNDAITHRLLEGAMDCFVRHEGDLSKIDTVYCPGSFEIPLMAQTLAGKKSYDAVVCIGCLIRGETPHFDYIAGEVTKGIAQTSLACDIPIGFGVLTTDSMEQAIDRAGGKSGNKGWDAALSVIEMVNVRKLLVPTK
jgi:6,7-dimethyl-8-ribityllumazine synthase